MAAEFADPHRLAALGVTRFVRFAANRGWSAAERLVAAARTAAESDVAAWNGRQETRGDRRRSPTVETLVLGGILVADEIIDLFLPIMFYRIRLRRLRQPRSLDADGRLAVSSPSRLVDGAAARVAHEPGE